MNCIRKRAGSKARPSGQRSVAVPEGTARATAGGLDDFGGGSVCKQVCIFVAHTDDSGQELSGGRVILGEIAGSAFLE